MLCSLNTSGVNQGLAPYIVTASMAMAATGGVVIADPVQTLAVTAYWDDAGSGLVLGDYTSTYAVKADWKHSAELFTDGFINYGGNNTHDGYFFMDGVADVDLDISNIAISSTLNFSLLDENYVLVPYADFDIRPTHEISGKVVLSAQGTVTKIFGKVTSNAVLTMCSHMKFLSSEGERSNYPRINMTAAATLDFLGLRTYSADMTMLATGSTDFVTSLLKIGTFDLVGGATFTSNSLSSVERQGSMGLSATSSLSAIFGKAAYGNMAMSAEGSLIISSSTVSLVPAAFDRTYIIPEQERLFAIEATERTFSTT